MQITGTRFDDQLFGIEGEGNLISGLPGNDTMTGASLTDVINGGPGDDFAFGRAGDDQVLGGLGNDTLFGGLGNDLLDGDLGNDLLKGVDGNDVLNGRLGDDFLYGGEGDDQLFGGDGNDLMDGGDGEGFGFHGFDFLGGQSGNDLLIMNYGGAFGGLGNDTFVTNLNLGGLAQLSGELGADLYIVTVGNEGGAGTATVQFRADDFLRIEARGANQAVLASSDVFDILDTNDDGIVNRDEGVNPIGSVTRDAAGSGMVITIFDDTLVLPFRQNIADFQMS